MDIPLSQRLAFKQARMTVLLALVIGSLLSLLQIALDYASADAAINHEARTLLEISRQPAARELASPDPQRARDLLEGLLQAPAIVHAELLDANGTALANASRPALEDGWQHQLSNRLFGGQRTVAIALPEGTEHRPGLLRLEVDTYVSGSRFLERAGITLARCLLATLLLSLSLFGLYYLQLTRPLTALIEALDKRDPQLADQPPLPCPAPHRHDEIGMLISVCNHQLARLGAEVDQRRRVEARLTRSLGELEERVQERTRALESSNRELQQTQQQAMAMAQTRAQFLANMSHEIRTPLNGLLGMLALALDGPLPAQQRQQLMIAHDSGRMLVELLNGVLDLSKFEFGQLELEQTPFDLASLVEEASSLLSQNAAPGVELSCLIAPDLPGEVIGDPLRVRQILNNLLSNALKFTRHGRVDVRLAALADDILLEVRDTGIGIAPEALSRIFQPFTQAEAGISRKFGGTGLGLTLTRRLCEAMQGTLEVSSQPGLGSRFSVRLPLPAHASASALPPLQGKVIALCSKRSGLSELLETWLPTWGLTYRRLDPDDSLAGVGADLLISDCPDCLFGLRPLTAAPILLVSAYGELLPEEEEARLQPLEQAARPLSRATLYQALQRHLNHSALPAAADSRALAQQEPRILLVEDNPVNQLVVKGLLARLGLGVAVARHGEEALKMLHQRVFDLVLMDCNLPLMDGYEATRQIRRERRWATLPVIALTANVLPEDRERCQQAGMNDYLSKPLRREELQAMLEHWLPHGLPPKPDRASTDQRP
ncbi:MAG TPA: ATP-binding protein [Pseudomonas sp.]|nr:ATP-binding protein [Pseudomonas sp.]